MTLRPHATLKILPSLPLLLAGPLLCVTPGCGDGSSEPPESPGSPGSPEPPPAAVEEGPVRAGLSELLTELGVTWLPADERLEVTGWVNLSEGPIEVFACSPGGKTHESVIVLDCVPRGLQAGLLALGLAPGAPLSVDESGVVTPPSGDRVELTVTWSDEEGTARSARAEDWIKSGADGQAMPRGGWIFAGSLEADSTAESGEPTFAADSGRSLVTTYYDATSILESPDELAGNDEAWAVNHEVIPPVGTEVTLILRAATEGETR